MIKFVAAVFFISLFSVPGFAQSQRVQTNNFNSWFMYFGTHKFSDKWGVHAEAQVRRNEGLRHPLQVLLRTGLNYHFSNQSFVTLGYCFVETYPYGEFGPPAQFPEHRLWQQWQIKNQIGKLEMVNRFRLEQRWVQAPILQGNSFAPGPAVYSNRGRIFNRFSLPFSGSAIVPKSWYATMYHEVLLSWGKNVAYNLLDQNRIYGALGYSVPRLGRIELGYMHQLLIKGDGIKVENNHNLQIGLLSNLNLYKPKVLPKG